MVNWIIYFLFIIILTGNLWQEDMYHIVQALGFKTILFLKKVTDIYAIFMHGI